MGLYLAVDAGGTNTTYLLADDHRELARTVQGSIKRMRVSAEEATSHLADAVDDLQRASGILLAGVTSCCIGTAGETVPLVTDWIHTEFTRLMPKAQIIILGDVEIALDAAFPGSRGVLVLAGTGSNICGRSSDGHITSAGGYGPIIGDVGSGFWIGREGLRAAFSAMDYGRPSRLMQAIATVWNVASPEEVIAKAHSLPSPDLSKLSRIVADCADEGDPAALDVLSRAGEGLAQLALLVMKNVQAIEHSDRPTGVATAGSILKHVTHVRKAFRATLLRQHPGLQINDKVIDPVHGALYRARQGR